MIYCGQRATEPNALSKGTQPVLETGGFGHDAVSARGVFSPQLNRGMGILEKSSNFPALQDTAPPMALLSPLHPCVRRALAAPWALLVATFLVPGWKWMNLHFRCIALLVSGWMHWVTKTTVVLQKSRSAWPGLVSEEMFFYSNTWSFTVLRQWMTN